MTAGHHRFATAIQGAATVGEVQRAFLASARHAVPAGGVAFCRIRPDTGEVRTAVSNVCRELLRDYETRGQRDDPVLAHLVAHREPIDSSRAARPAAWNSSGARAALRLGGFTHSLLVPLVVGDRLYGTLNFARTAREGPFSRADLTAARRCGEHVQLAVGRGLRAETAERALRLVAQHVVVTDESGNVLDTNQPVSPELGAAIVASVTHLHRSARKVLTHRVGPYVLRSSRTSEYQVLTLVHHRDRGEPPSWDVLSPREREIAELVLSGLDTQHIAARLHITGNTVKQHLKRAFQKTGVHSRAELMRYVRPGSPDRRPDTGCSAPP